MRDDAFYEEDIESTTRPVLTRAFGAGAGALVSLALLAGVVVWAYRLGAQDAREVPVIRAAEGPNRIAPEDPGGVQFEHQGLAVYESISGGDDSDDVALAPGAERPAADDRPIVSAMEPGGIAPGAQPEEPEIASLGSVEPSPESPSAAPIAPVEPEASQAAASPSVEETIDSTIFAPRKAPSPARRPGSIRAAAATTDEMTAPTRQAPRISAATGAAVARALAAAESPYQIQLGAFGSDSDARRQWEAVKSRNPDLLAGLELIVQPVESGGRMLYRMRAAPFEDRPAAVSICEALKNRGQACIVARSG